MDKKLKILYKSINKYWKILWNSLNIWKIPASIPLLVYYWIRILRVDYQGLSIILRNKVSLIRYAGIRLWAKKWHQLSICLKINCLILHIWKEKLNLYHSIWNLLPLENLTKGKIWILSGMPSSDFEHTIYIYTYYVSDSYECWKGFSRIL